MRDARETEMVLGKAGMRLLVTKGSVHQPNDKAKSTQTTETSFSLYLAECVYVISLLLNVFAAGPL